MTSRSPKLFACLAVVALFICGQAFAEDKKPEVPHHWHISVMPHNSNGLHVQANIGGAPPANLYSLGEQFVTEPNPPFNNSDASDYWPCFGTGGSGTAENPDCPTLGDPTIPFPGGAAVLGTPTYVWYLNANSTDAPLQPFGCLANTTADATNYCGQTNTWYEDWSNDTADELLYTLEATQNGSVIADSGTVDFGPNTFGGLVPAADVVIYGDQNFGTDGVATGPNNGNCEMNFDYPLTAPSYPGVYVVAAKKTCVNPVASSSISGAITLQEVKLTATTEIGTPAYTHSTSAVTCAGTAGPPYSCYTVKWTSVHKLTQSWYIWMR
jgi:hypothetical protein